jgi:hypothetical protein
MVDPGTRWFSKEHGMAAVAGAHLQKAGFGRGLLA